MRSSNLLASAEARRERLQVEWTSEWLGLLSVEAAPLALSAQQEWPFVAMLEVELQVPRGLAAEPFEASARLLLAEVRPMTSVQEELLAVVAAAAP